MRTPLDRLGRPASRVVLLLFASAFGAAGCADDHPSGPTAAAESPAAPAAATASTAPLFDKINAGDLHTCAVALDDRAWCWGWNSAGQLGDGTTTERLRPVLVKGGHHYTFLDAGIYETCAIGTDTRTWCWGKLPAGTLESLKFRQVAVGSEHNCGVTTANKAYCWGINTFGQLGNGTFESNPVFQGVFPVMGGLSFRKVSVGRYHSCGITMTDKLYCWGGDQWGQVGDGSGSDTCGLPGWELPCRLKPTLVVGGHLWRQVSAGSGSGPGEDNVGGDDGAHTCGVTDDNKAYCWGAAAHGQLGNGSLMMRKAPVLVSGGLMWESITAARWHTCGLTTERLAYCWGYNWAGMLGDGTLMQRNMPRAVTGGHHFRVISAGGAHTCALTPGNVAWCWGLGAVGDGTRTVRKLPVKVIGPS